MRVITFAFISALCLAGCSSGQKKPQPHPFTGALPIDTSVDLRGTFTFSLSGELVLALATPCTVASRPTSEPAPAPSYCNRAFLDAIQVTAMMPWHGEVNGIWIDANHIAFRIDWKTCGLDPLADDASDIVTRPWRVSGTRWIPNFSEAERILKLVENATETETELIRGGDAPSLEVTSFEVQSVEGTNNSFHAGGEDDVVVKITNRGIGTAYRVTATTRSSIPSLHGKRLSFGRIRPGAEKVRRLRVTIPASETSPDTMLVLVPAEGNGFTPRNLSRRIPITASKATPILAVRCSLIGHTGARPELDGGDEVVLHCTVENSGTIGADVELETSIAGGAPARSVAQAITPAGHASFDVPITVPRTLTINSSVEIAITAHDRKTPRAARAQLIGVVRKPRVCSAGTLTRSEYNSKLAALRAEVSAGVLKKAAFDRYDAELVTCMR
jgi:hypothetical protein